MPELSWVLWEVDKIRRPVLSGWVVFEFLQVRPRFLEGRDSASSEVWGAHVTMKTGERCAVVGPSGSGKSTFLRLMLGRERPVSGQVLVDGKSLETMNDGERLRMRSLDVAVVFQDLRLFRGLTGWENVGLTPHWLPGLEDSRVREWAAVLGVATCLDRPVSEVSQGQAQRIALIRALVRPFSWLVLDEPFSHLDAERAAEAMAWVVARCGERGAGMVLTSLDRQGLSGMDQVWEVRG